METNPEDSCSLPRTRDVLHEHIHAVISSLVENKDYVGQITGMVAVGTDLELMQLLASPERMRERVEQAQRLIESSPAPPAGHVLPSGVSQDGIGELLFDKVAEFESELSAQITGMLLELPPQKVECLLHDNDALQAAVTRARIEYLSEHHPETLPSQEQLAQEVYEEALQMYPAEAGHITGMLLELSSSKIMQLLECPDQLRQRITQAYGALKASR